MSRIVTKIRNMVETGEVNEGQVFQMLDMVNIQPRQTLPSILQYFAAVFMDKSDKIKVAITVFQYFVKNCNESFHQSTNNARFQEAFRSLFKHRRNKAGIISSFRSNRENWDYIEQKALYILQLWYDAFMLEEGKYRHIIGSYKLLREEGIEFPVRQVNEKNMLSVKTCSPIFDNLEMLSKEEKKRKTSKMVKPPPFATMAQMREQKQKIDVPLEVAMLHSLGDELEIQLKEEREGGIQFVTSQLARQLQEAQNWVRKILSNEKLSEDQKKMLKTLTSRLQALTEHFGCEKVKQSMLKESEFSNKKAQQPKQHKLSQFKSIFRSALQNQGVGMADERMKTVTKQQDLL